MARFEFKNVINPIDPADFLLPCAANHNHKIVILNAYDVDLYQSWTIEIEDFLRTQLDVEVLVVNIGSQFSHLQRSLVRELGYQATKVILRIYGKIENRYTLRYNYKIHRINLLASWKEAFRSSWRQLRQNSFTPTEPHEAVKYKSIFSTLATTLGTVEFQARKHPVKVISLNYAFEVSYRKTKRLIHDIGPCLVVTGNGRLVKPAAIVAASRNLGIPVRIIERGAFPGTFDLYKISPHSIEERRNRAMQLYARFGVEKAESISKRYLALRSSYDPISGLTWQRNFESGKLPILDRRKICVCFTSTETEFAVFGDTPTEHHFSSQEEAFMSLAASLNPTDWQVVIRRHPYAKGNFNDDPEQKLWMELGKMAHVKIIGPDEPIDSYALVRVANLVAHFNSSMGPEAIFMKACPVISMGPTLWENPESPYVVNSKEKIQNFVSSDLGIRNESDIYLWGLYWATFGYKFKIVEWVDSKGYVDGKRIL